MVPSALRCDHGAMEFSDRARAWHSGAHPSASGAVLLIHGFTGSPQSLRAWGEDLHSHGFEVSLPLLPGHGTTWQEMARTPWNQWYGAARQAAEELLERHTTISVGALSMGGTLALHLLADPTLDGRISAAALVNPALKLPWYAPAAALLAPIVGSVPGVASDIAAPGVIEEAYERTPLASVGQLAALQRRVRRELGQIRTPLLIATSPQDGVVDPRDSASIAAAVAGHVERMRLPRSRHVATLDHDAPAVLERSAAFFREYARTTDDCDRGPGSSAGAQR